MPSGPPDLHEKWCNAGPGEDGSQNAMLYLQAAGYRLTRRWEWILPNPKHKITPEEDSAILYLIVEWDFGGLAPDFKGFLFRHKKGGIYLRLFRSVLHTETNKPLTIYMHLYPHRWKVYARPQEMFEEPERFRRIL